MVLITQYTGKLYFGIEDKLLVYNETNRNTTTVNLPDINIPHNLNKTQEDNLQQEKRFITMLSTSKNCEFILTGTQNKQLVVFNQNLEVIKNILLIRGASRAKFTPNNDIVIADKTGDAYIYKIFSDEEPKLILGHLSMLLDVFVTDCLKFIITCDRDEKIRVSHFPNAYNIQSYCLGHKEFVTDIEMCGDVLISASGDGTIRFWNYLTGIQLNCIDTNEYVKDKEVIGKFCMKMDQDKVEVKALPIMKMQVYSTSDKAFIAVSLAELNAIQIFEVKFKLDQILHRYIQGITSKGILDFSLGDNLYVLTETGVILYKLERDNFVQTNIEDLNDYIRSYALQFEKCNNVSVLYKRKYDNVQEYLERKKLRISSK